MNSLNKED